MPETPRAKHYCPDTGIHLPPAQCPEARRKTASAAAVPTNCATLLLLHYNLPPLRIQQQGGQLVAGCVLSPAACVQHGRSKVSKTSCKQVPSAGAYRQFTHACLPAHMYTHMILTA